MSPKVGYKHMIFLTIEKKLQTRIEKHTLPCHVLLYFFPSDELRKTNRSYVVKL